MTVDIWLGTFPSQKRLDEYLEESYDDDASALSEFARDMNESFYDHDFFESSFHEAPTEDLGKILMLHLLAPSGIEVVVADFKRAPKPFNTVLLMWNEDNYLQVNNPTSVQKEGVQLRYLGRFDCAFAT